MFVFHSCEHLFSLYDFVYNLVYIFAIHQVHEYENTSKVFNCSVRDAIFSIDMLLKTDS